MNHIPSWRCVGRIIPGTICLLLAALLVGCKEGGAPPKTPGKTPGKAAAKSPDKTDAAAAMVQTGDAKVATATDKPAGKTDAKEEGDTVKVGACDGGNAVEVPKELKGQPLADSLMDQWKRNHPEAKWVAEEKERHTLKPAADNSDLLKGGQAKGDTYGNFTQRDLLTWARETEKFAAEGSRIFHSADELGSTVAVSCDMCHPHGANTHPETYPKFQVQLGRVVLLRDMINWCVENPVRGTKLEPDGPTMRALEAYILAQRKGVPMDYGKH
jgi:thiosulfate dehydrogenase